MPDRTMQETEARGAVPGANALDDSPGGDGRGTERGLPPGVAAGRARGGTAPRRLVWLALAAVVAGALGFGYWWMSRGVVGTDDAQIRGHIVPILARTTGYVSAIRADDNAHVAAGDTLVVLDDREIAIRLAREEAELDALLAASGGEDAAAGQAQAQLAAARSGAAAARADVAQAQAAADKARSDLRRYQALAEDRIASAQQIDAAEAAVRTADARLEAATREAQAASERVVAATAALHGADARVAAARAARDEAALQLSYTRIVAPVGGIVSKRSIEPGQLVQAGQPLMSVVPLDSIWVVANLKETDIRGVHVGDAVDIHVDAYPDRDFAGTVESVSAATGSVFSLLPPDNATGNFTKVVQRIPVRIRLAAPAPLDAVLRPGMNVRVSIRTG